MDTSNSTTEQVLGQAVIIVPDVLAEVKRSLDKFGVQDRHPFEWLAILSEEFGEASKEVCEFGFGGDIQPLVNLRTELIQVAAVAINFIASLDCNEFVEYQELISQLKLNNSKFK